MNILTELIVHMALFAIIGLILGLALGYIYKAIKKRKSD